MDFGCRRHDSGTFKGLPIYEERLGRINSGGRVTLVATVDFFDDQMGHLCGGLLTKQQFRLQGTLTEGITKVTIINAVVNHVKGPVLLVDDQSAILEHSVVTGTTLLQLVETCVGLGALGQGAAQAGWSVKVGNDHLQSFCDHLARLNKQVVCGDICKLQTVVEMHRASPDAKTMAFGFSCQPFSKLGDQRGGDDGRAQCLPFGLYASYLLQMQIVVLECTPTAPSSQFVKRCLQHHEDMTGFLKSEAILDIQGFWPTSRKRWWCIINNGAFGKIYVPPMPQIVPAPTVSDVIPKFLDLLPIELKELTLSGYERELFSSLGKGFDAQLVDINGTLPTALHSWGNQCIKCQCGCEREMSFERLRSQGLHGALVFVHNMLPSESIRHLSGREMALLNGFAKSDGWDDNQRFLTAGVGQLASPLQSSWVFSHIRQQLQQFQFIPHDESQPKQILACMALDVLRLRDQWYPSLTTVAMDLFQGKIEEMLENIPPQPVGSSEEFVGKTIIQDDDHDILSHVIRVEQSIASPFDVKTGGMVAFSSTPMSGQVEQPPFVEKPVLSEVRVDEPLPLTKDSPDDVLMLEPPIDSTESTNPEQHESKGVAVNILNNNVMIFDLIHRQFRAVSVGGDQTVSALLAAELSLSGEKGLKLFTCLGDELPSNKVLENHQIYVLAHSLKPFEAIECGKLEFHLSPMTRLHSCLLQNHFVASDELTYYLQAVSTMHEVRAVPPLLVFDLCDVVQSASQWWNQCTQDSLPVVTAVCQQHHWIPIRIEHKGSGSTTVVTTTEGGELWQLLQISTPVSIEVRHDIISHFDHDCGFQVLSWHITLSADQPMEYIQLHDACKWRFLFWQNLLVTRPSHPIVLCLGGASELETSLMAILKEHGVFPDRLTDRVKQVLTKLGHQPVISALRSARPWASLKSLASNQSIRLVQPDEFEAIVKDRTKDSKSVHSRKKQQPKTTVSKDVMLSPSEVFIPEGVFCQHDGTLLPQLGLRQISPQAKGIVLVTEQEVQPYLTQGMITQQGLGLLVMAPYTSDIEQVGTSIRFPAQSRTTGEPVLLSAILIQKGAQDVSRALPSVAHQVDQIDTQTVKFMVYRDQCQSEWDEVCKHPIKYILGVMSCLQVCKQPNCQCGKWHPATADASEPIVDLWQRDFLTVHFRKAKASEAQLFTCFMRVTQPAFAVIHRMSGMQGVFVEPRSPDGRRHDEAYHTVWMAKQSYEEAVALQTTLPVETALVRVTFRYGFRAKLTEASQVHQKVKPETPFLPGGSKLSFVVGPLPFGVTRKSLTKLFAEWDWSAHAIQPVGRSADMQGLMWTVHANDPPKHTVYTMAHGDLMITRDESSIPKVPKLVTPQISALTRQQKENEAWDPWANAAKQLPSANSSSQASSVAAIEQVVEQRVLAKLQTREDTPMESSEHESRLNNLESQVQQLVANQQAADVRTQQVASHVESLHSQVEGYHGAVQSCIEKCIDSKLSEQMQKIEALLSKRPRNE